MKIHLLFHANPSIHIQLVEGYKFIMPGTAGYPSRQSLGRLFRDSLKKLRSYEKLVKVTRETIDSYNSELRDIYSQLVAVTPRNRALYMELSRRMEFKVEILENMKSLYASQVRDLKRISDHIVQKGIQAFNSSKAEEVKSTLFTVHGILATTGSWVDYTCVVLGKHCKSILVFVCHLQVLWMFVFWLAVAFKSCARGKQLTLVFFGLLGCHRELCVRSE